MYYQLIIIFTSYILQLFCGMLQEDISSDLQSIMSQKQFVKLSQEIQLESLRRQKLMKSIYHKNNPKTKQRFLRYDPDSTLISTFPGNKYEEQYLKWKQSDTQNSSEMKYQSQIRNLHKYQTQAQLRQISRGISAKRRDIAKIELSNNLKVINQEYKQKLKLALSTHHYQINKAANRLYELEKEQPLFTDKKSQSKQITSIGIMADPGYQETVKKSNQFDRSNFQSMIKRPPKDKQILTLQPPQQTKFPQKPPEQELFLDIQAILKIPHYQFLIFFQHNLRVISRLATSQQMARLIDYRDEALRKEHLLQRLRQKVSSANPDTIQKLPKEKKEKLFRLLYENK